MISTGLFSTGAGLTGVGSAGGGGGGSSTYFEYKFGDSRFKNLEQKYNS